MIRRLADITRAALKGETYQGPVSNEQRLHRLAKGAGISGMLYPALRQAPLTEEIISAFRRDHFKYIQNDTFQQEAADTIRHLFNDAGIRFIFLKGTTLKTMYPAPHMRSMGDIDVLIDAEDMDKAHEVLGHHGFHNWHNSANHDCFVTKRQVFVEVHPKLNSDFDERYDALFSDVWAWTTRMEGHEHGFRPAYMYVYMLYHAIKHVRHSGIGFRTLVDLYVFLDHHDDTMDWTAVDALVEKADMTRFHVVMLHALSTWFDVDYRHRTRYDLPVSEETLERLSAYILASGVHGKNEGHNPFIGKIAKSQTRGKNRLGAKIRFAFHMMFLPLETMKGMEPVLHKHPWLLPYAWVKRWFRIIFGRGHSIKKIKYLNPDKKQMGEVTALLHDLDL